MVWTFGQMPPWRVVSGLSNWEASPGKTLDPLERLYLSMGLRTSCPGGAGGRSQGDVCLGLSPGAADCNLELNTWLEDDRPNPNPDLKTKFNLQTSL